jgi:hypothetical protein
MRTASAIWSFRQKYGRWPTRLRVPPYPEEALEWTYGGPENLRRIRERLVIVEDLDLLDFCSVAVEDDEGHRVKYPSCGLGYDAEVVRWIPVRF